MKDLIIKALEDAWMNFYLTIPQTKKQDKFLSIEGIKPSKVSQFMLDNNVPDSAVFGAKYIECTDVYICWDLEVPTTNTDKTNYCRNMFGTFAFKYVYNTLTANGYMRVGFLSSALKAFKDTSVYDMYVINKDYDRLVQYYSLYFAKV